ncbi:hypothetical protein ES705_41030 [subsurface metagenome]
MILSFIFLCVSVVVLFLLFLFYWVLTVYLSKAIKGRRSKAESLEKGER